METARLQSATDLVFREGRDTPKSGQDLSMLGIKAKLFLAFCAMAGFTILAAAIAWYAFEKIERSVDRITAESVPAMAISLRLAEKSAEIASTAPALVASVDQEERISAQTRLEQRSEELANLMHDLKATGIELKTVEDLRAIQADITRRLGALNEAVRKRLRLKSQREIALKGMAAAHGQFAEVLAWSRVALARSICS
jgi:phosphoglycerate-specific signal transduction histidine kinase